MQYLTLEKWAGNNRPAPYRLILTDQMVANEFRIDKNNCVMSHPL